MQIEKEEDLSKYNDDVLRKEIDVIEPNKLKNMIFIPVLEKETREPIAILEAYNHSENVFTEEEENLLKYIAETASVQFHHSKLHKQAMLQEKLNKGLVEIMKVVSQADIKEDILKSLTKLVEIGYNIVDCERVTVFLLDASTHTLHCKYIYYI